ncbi:MAG: hypothetical protein PHX74_07855 [Candidatus Sumerlaeales bacterium]|nr:hypothetical protein [Candidatus Sumerlaeales bacterium]
MNDVITTASAQLAATMGKPVISTNIVEYTVIGAYFIFMIITGILFRRFNSNFTDYFRSGCRGTWWMVGASIFMASFTAWTFTGASGQAYTAGIVVSVIFMANTFGYIINALWTAPYFRQMRATTAPEIIAERFDTTTQQMLVWYGLIPGILSNGLTLWAVAFFAAPLFGFDVLHMIIILGAVVVIYSTIGGSWSVMATDFLQALILVPMTVLLAILSYNAIGGYDGFMSAIQAPTAAALDTLGGKYKIDGVSDLSYMIGIPSVKSGQFNSWAAVIAMFAYVFVAYNSVGSSVKYFTVKDGREARKAAWLSAILMGAGVFLWFLPSMVCRLKFPELVDGFAATHPEIKTPADASFALVSMQLLPKGMVGLVVVAMFAATMSSLGPSLNSNAAIFTQDVYKKLFNPKASDRTMFLLGQFTSFLMGILIILAAIFLATRSTSTGESKSLFDWMIMLGSVFGTPTLVPMFAAMFMRKTPPWSGLISILFALPITIYQCFAEFDSNITPLNYQQTIFSIIGLGMIGMFVSKLWWKSVPEDKKERIAGFYQRMMTPVDFEKEVGHANDPAQLKLVGYVSLSIGFFILFLLFVPNTFAARLQILAVALSICLFAGCMILTGYKRSAKQQNITSLPKE